jgi:hypothetical protein
VDPYRIVDSAFDEETPYSITYEDEELTDMDITAYGYGFWMRFLNTHKSFLTKGLSASTYFVSRLVSHRDH